MKLLFLIFYIFSSLQSLYAKEAPVIIASFNYDSPAVVAAEKKFSKCTTRQI
jgi:hypothetical protein